MNVYIIKNEENYKIGKSNDVIKRLKALQTGSPSPHELIAVKSTSNAIALEHNIHAHLSAYRISGEWFELDNKILNDTIYKFGFNETLVSGNTLIVQNNRMPVIQEAKQNLDNTFFLSNNFIQAKYEKAISFWEMVILGRMCTLVDCTATDFKEYRIYIIDLIRLVEVEKTGHLYGRILDAAIKLKTHKIAVKMKNEIGEEHILDTYIVTDMGCVVTKDRTENAYISLTFHPHLKPFLLELKRDFTKFDIRNYKFLHSGTITRLYQLLKSYYDRRRDPQFDLDELKQMLGVANKYRLYANFRIKVLDEAQRKLAAGTDIKFTYNEVKKGNKVADILFHIAVNEEGEFAKWRKNTEGPDVPNNLR